jgi:pilus assembly protein Flp/PilA
MWQIFRQCLDDESGVTAIEYGLIAALISIVIVTINPRVGDALSSTFTTVATALQ